MSLEFIRLNILSMFDSLLYRRNEVIQSKIYFEFDSNDVQFDRNGIERDGEK